MNSSDEILEHHFTMLQAGGGKRLMIFVESYFDESGTHAGSAFVVVAGFAAYAADWLPFSVAWGSALSAAPPIEYFHSVEANSRCGEFKGWDRGARDSKVIALLDVIRSERPQPLISAVRPSEYCRLLAEFPDALMPRDPYIFCFQNIILECFHLGKLIREKTGEQVRVALNFEQNDEMENVATSAYKLALNWNPHLSDMLAPTISYLPKKEFKPLQAADVLAYDFNKEFSRQQQNPSSPMRKSLEAILAKMPRFGLHWPWDYDSLRKLFIKGYDIEALRREQMC